MISLFQTVILLAGTLIGGITDAKTGYIYDWITIPMIIIGIILSLIGQFWFNLQSGVIIFLILFFAYKFGKIGGGDVKLFTAIALLNPFNQINFLISLFLISAIVAMLFYSIYYSIKYIKNYGLKNIEKKEILKGIGLILAILIYFYILILSNLISILFIVFFGIPFLSVSIFFVFQKEISRKFFEKKMSINKLDEDEILSNSNSKNIFEIVGNKNLIEKKEINLLKKHKIKNIIVMRNLPKFGPFIFIGTLVSIITPNLILLIF